MNEVLTKAKLGKVAARAMNNTTTEQKNKALLLIADALVARDQEIIQANAEDLERGRQGGIRESLIDRLELTSERVAAMAQGLREVVELEDPVGDVLAQFERPNGLSVRQVRVPLGLIGMIYEARPNVTVDAAGLCLKTGNAVLLRGGSAALSSNRKIVEVIHDALAKSDLPVNAVMLVEDAARESVDQMLKLNGLLDVVIPRGGAALIQNVVQNATVPVIETGAGICHTFIDESADVQMAAAIAFNAKVQRPSVCNAMETLFN
jgi:glutamate-5-semialdehyde dehydrogenase